MFKHQNKNKILKSFGSKGKLVDMTKSSCGVWSSYKPQTCASGSGLDRAEEFGVPSPQVDASRKLGISNKEKK